MKLVELIKDNNPTLKRVECGFIFKYKAYLYGSHLYNTATKDSDIDLMIVTDKEYDDYLVGKIWSLTKKVNSKIEPFLIGSNRFNSNDDSPLVDLAKRTGLEIK